MARTHIFLRCMHPKLEKGAEGGRDRSDEDGKIKKRPTLVGQLGGSRSGKSL
jgi:hypothetical protein